jgi:heme exporter protein CcmD
MNHFLNMGGYALYVWPAYAIVLFMLGIYAWVSMAKLRRALTKTNQSVDEKSNATASATNHYSY